MNIFTVFPLLFAVLAQGLAPGITSPRPGDALQGTVQILGTSETLGFASYELDFCYAGDTTRNWFQISSSTQPVQAGTLGQWDTTQITDGNYDLRLEVALEDGSKVDIIVPDLRVRNYTAVETSTPGQAPPTATPSPTTAFFPTPTALPANPAGLTTAEIEKSFGYGGSGAVLLILILALYVFLRRR
jgi:hypothetical protein